MKYKPDILGIVGEISNVLSGIPTLRRTCVDRPAKTYIHHFCADTGCLQKDLSSLIGQMATERERERDRERERSLCCLDDDDYWI